MLTARERALIQSVIDRCAGRCDDMGGWRDWWQRFPNEKPSHTDCAWAADVLADDIRALTPDEFDAPEEEQPEPKVGETWLVPGGKVVDIHTSPSGTRLVTLSEYGHVHGRVFMADWLRAHGRRVEGA